MLVSLTPVASPWLVAVGPPPYRLSLGGKESEAPAFEPLPLLSVVVLLPLPVVVVDVMVVAVLFNSYVRSRAMRSR